MKNTLKILAALAALGFASVASAVNIPASGKVTMYNTPIDGGETGGLFRGAVTGVGGFYTFCIEHGTNIVFNQELDYVLDNKTAPGGDVISKATAFLYKEFTLGNLFDPILANSTQAGMLQLAIWHLEDEASAPNVDKLGANTFIADMIVKYGSLAAAKADDDVGEVKVMNLSSETNRDIQDVLVYHVSESGLTIALLGAALTVLGFARRRVS